MEWLKEILKDYVGDDKLDEVITKTNENFPKHAIPKNKFNSVNDELKEYKTKTDDLQKQISDLSNSDKSKELQAELEKVNSEFNTFKGDENKRGGRRGRGFSKRKYYEEEEEVEKEEESEVMTRKDVEVEGED